MSDIESIDAILMACEDLNVHNLEKCSRLEEGQTLNFIYNKACIVKKDIWESEKELSTTKARLKEAEQENKILQEDNDHMRPALNVLTKAAHKFMDEIFEADKALYWKLIKHYKIKELEKANERSTKNI